jgi:superfamily II DNA/RNA helicase
MIIEDPEYLLNNLKEYSEKYKAMKLESQAHARSILSVLKSNEEDWPLFRKDLDQRLYFMSHYLIFESLNLLEIETYENEAKLYLKDGAEVLEYLYKYPNLNNKIKGEVLLKSIFAYYISGNYARAYVLAKEIDEFEYSPVLSLIVSLLGKNLINSRLLTLKIFNDSKYSEKIILEEFIESNIDEYEAISRVLVYSISKIISFYLEYIKTGNLEHFVESNSILETCIKLAKTQHMPDVWWWLYCLSFIFKEYQQNSFWNLLKPFRENDSSEQIDNYIKNYLSFEPPVIEYWPSQVKAIAMVNDEERRDFLLKMPTSSGKTQIAELTILRFLLDYSNSGKKCVYIAPYRSLAVEVEKSFRKSLGSIGYKVSEIYGKFELNPAEKFLIDQNQILIVTPEKFDAILRYVPQMWDNIGLIVIDEGHIIDPNERGLRFEFFIQRLLTKYKDKDCRFLFISAVLPNADEFAKWITGSPKQLVQSRWRPSRQMIGRLTWTGEHASIDYTYTENGEFDQECFVPKFIEKTKCKGLPGVGKRRNPFPTSSREALALSSLLFAKESTTLVFIPKKNHINSFCDDLIDALKFQGAIEKFNGNTFHLPAPDKESEIFKRCVGVIHSELGNDSKLINYLENGFIIHHAGLPGPVRIAIEELIRSNQISLIIATSTLAEGVNLPIKTVIVKDLYYGHNQLIDTLRFWNVCGRAGRAGKENEGQILFYLNKTVDSFDNKINDMNKLINGLETSRVISTIFRVLNVIVKEWKNNYPKVDIAELCVYLADNSYEWVSEARQKFIQKLINILDSHLLSFTEESNIESISPEDLQDILKTSLLFIQIQNRPSNLIDEDLASKIFSSRINYINTKYPQNVRKRFYKLGMILPDCEKIEANRDQLHELIKQANYWDDFNQNKQITLLTEISEYILSIEEVIADKVKPAEWDRIISFWLQGFDTSDMVKDRYISKFSSDPTQLRLFIEDFCGYRLPWGLNSVISYLKSYINENKEIDDIPLISLYFSGMYKYGVCDPIAVCILPYLDQKRDLALEVSKICPFKIENPDKIIDWFKELTLDELLNNGINEDICHEIMKNRDYHSYNELNQEYYHIKFESTQTIVNDLHINEQLLVFPQNDNTIQILTLDGHNIGEYVVQEIPDEWFNFNLISAYIEEIESLDEGYSIIISLK